MLATEYGTDHPRTILVPTDRSDAAAAALGLALSIADGTDAVIQVLAVDSPGRSSSSVSRSNTVHY